MGYYSTLTVDTYEETKVRPFEVKDETKGYQGGNVEWSGFWGTLVDEEGNVEMDEYYGKFYDAEDFAKLLASKMESGRIVLHFLGEDGGQYGYVVEPNAVAEYNGDNYSQYYIENGKELMLKLLKEKKNELTEKIEEIEKKIKELSD